MIIVTLLTNKQFNLESNELATSYTTSLRGESVIAGENNATTIKVIYPNEYASFEKYVDMVNADTPRGYARIYFDDSVGYTEFEFTLPNTMTYAGNTRLAFSATEEDVISIWQAVIIPIIETGIDYTKVALANSDVLYETQASSAEAVESANQAVATANEAIRIANEAAGSVVVGQGTIIEINDEPQLKVQFSEDPQSQFNWQVLNGVFLDALDEEVQ